mgnify:CR=1 FL=1
MILVSHDVSVVSRHVNKVVCVNVSVVEHPATEIGGVGTALSSGEERRQLGDVGACGERTAVAADDQVVGVGRVDQQGVVRLTCC